MKPIRITSAMAVTPNRKMYPSDSAAYRTIAPEKKMGQTDSSTGWGSLRSLSGYQWFVFSVAAIAWMADCMDQQLFNLARKTAITDLTGGDPNAKIVTEFASWSTSIFLVGWAVGGLIFGMFGDRLGRVRTLT